MKLLMNPNLEFDLEALIDDLKIFSIVMINNFTTGEPYQVSDMNNIQGNENNYNTMYEKNNNDMFQNENTLNMIKK